MDRVSLETKVVHNEKTYSRVLREWIPEHWVASSGNIEVLSTRGPEEAKSAVFEWYA